MLITNVNKKVNLLILVLRIDDSKSGQGAFYFSFLRSNYCQYVLEEYGQQV